MKRRFLVSLLKRCVTVKENGGRGMRNTVSSSRKREKSPEGTSGILGKPGVLPREQIKNKVYVLHPHKSEHSCLVWWVLSLPFILHTTLSPGVCDDARPQETKHE